MAGLRLTRRPLDLAWVGLASSCRPRLVSRDRPRGRPVRTPSILMACTRPRRACRSTLGAGGRRGNAHASIYAVLVGVGAARAFQGPPTRPCCRRWCAGAHFGNAVAWGSSFSQAATVARALARGLRLRDELCRAPAPSTSACGGSSLAAFALVAGLARRIRYPARAPARDLALGGGALRLSNPVVLGAMSLDLFAVLLGGHRAPSRLSLATFYTSGRWRSACSGARRRSGVPHGVLLALFPFVGTWGSNAGLRRDLRGGHHRLRAVQELRAVSRRCCGRRGRHGQRVRSSDPRATRDARRHAREGQRREPGVHRRQQ